jgi:hypothetical protein
MRKITIDIAGASLECETLETSGGRRYYRAAAFRWDVTARPTFDVLRQVPA